MVRWNAKSSSRELFANICLVASIMLVVALCIAARFASAKTQHQEESDWNWSAYGGEPQDSHFVPLKQINKSNVDQLQVAWTYPTQDSLSYSFNPLEMDGVLYVQARNTSLVALDAASGKEMWVHAGLAGMVTRGIAYWQSKDGKDKRLIFAIHHQLQEINAQTGQSILTFGNQGFVDLRAGLGRPVNEIYAIQPRSVGEVYGNLIVVGSVTGEQYLAPPGDVRAYDIVTGKQVWDFHTVPHPGEVGYDTWPKGFWKYAGGGDVWGDFSIDEQRGIVYLPTGGPKYELYGGDRKGTNLFSDALVALNAETGKYLWSFQAVHHDVWDYDMVSAPQLITVEHDGKKVDAVATAGKTCFLYVLDRVTGKPLWPIVEKPVPQSHVPGESTWPTQPFPTAPPPFCAQQFTAADIDPYIPQEQREQLVNEIAEDLNGPIFTPPETQETIEMPGNQGGANWGMSASDPATGMVYQLGVNAPALLEMSLQSPYQNSAAPGGSSSQSTAGETPGHIAYQQHCAACHGENRQGNGAIPSLVNITIRLTPDAIAAKIQNGSGQMPAFGDLTQLQISEIISFLDNPITGGRSIGMAINRPGGPDANAVPVQLGGDVVAWGGAPAGRAANPHTGEDTNPYGVMNGPPYPKGLSNAPEHRYFTDWNVHFGFSAPPWNTLTAYNLNAGTIQWQVSVGTSPGLVRKQVGAVVTASGLVFLATTDGKVRAYDADTGKILWTGDLPAGAYAIPAMYQWQGREYLVISATEAIDKPGYNIEAASETTAGNPKIQRAYVAFALPEQGRH
jgi:quinoprotein glucose dehydrogenase